MTERNTSRKARTTYLEPGKDSIDRATVTTATINGKRVKVLRWSARFADGDLKAYRTQGELTDSDQSIRNKARRKLRDETTRREAGVAETLWTGRDRIAEYIAKVSLPRVDAATTASGEPLRDNSKRQYRRALELVQQALKGKSIAAAVKFSVLESMLENIARERGSETARQCRNVLSRFVLDRLRRDGVITREQASMLKGEHLDIPKVNKGRAQKITHGKALSRTQWGAVIDHLLAIDPTEVERSSRGRYGPEVTIAKRRNAVDLTLLQAATGLRVSEALALLWSDVKIDDQGVMFVTVRAEVSKTHEPRTVPVQHPEVTRRLLERQKGRKRSEYVIGSPVDPGKPWENRNAHRVLEDLYVELAGALGIEGLEGMRSHSWRTTLNSLHAETLSADRRAALFGHSKEINGKHYLDKSDTAAIVESARHLRVVS